MSRYVSDTAAGKSISAYVIMKGARHVATVTAHFSNGGRFLVNVRQDSKGAARSLEAATKAGEKPAGDMYFQSATAGGYGYDKFTAALSGMWVDGHAMTDHCGARIKPPRGLGYFPENYKPKRGYRLANWSQFDRATGKPRPSYFWRDEAERELGDGAEWDAIKARADELKAAADLVGGYSDCYRDEALKYLQAIGYAVIQAI